MRPPRWAEWLLRRRLSEPTRSYLLGDLEERFRAMARDSPGRARRWYVRQALSALVHRVPGSVGVDRPSFLGALRTDLRHSLRVLRARPMPTLAAVLTLGLGIGVVATSFSILWGTVLRGLPFERAGDLVHFERARLSEGVTSLAVTPHDYLAWREAQRSFEDLGAYVERAAVLPTEAGPPERVLGVAISPGSFPLLRVDAAIGRTFTAEEAEPGSPPVALLSHRLWVGRFGSDPGIVGSEIRMNDRPTTVVGVMPEGFGFPIAEQFWFPLRLDLTAVERGQGRLDVFGRLRDGVTLETARSEFEAITSEIAEAYPGTNAGITASLSSFDDEYVGSAFTGTVRRMVAGSLLLLLVCCANVANLLLVQGFQRRRSMALRLALGATRAGVVRQLLVETLVLASLGALLGIALAARGVSWFNRVGTGAGVFDLPHGPDSLFWWNVSLDVPTLVVIVASAGLTAGLSGLVPALLASRRSTLREGRGAGAGPGPRRTLTGIVVAQLVLTSGLLVAAGFVAESVSNVSRAGTGFDGDGVLVASVTLDGPRFPDHASRVELTEALLARLASDPNVRSAAYGTDVPLDPPRTGPVRIEGRSPEGGEDPEVGILTVSPDFFDVFGVRATEGRVFAASDRAGGPPVALVNRRFVEDHLGGSTPIGARLRVGGPEANHSVEVVGVVPDLWERPGDPTREAGVYLPLSQVGDGDETVALGPWGLYSVTLAVRPRAGASLTASVIRDHVFRLDAGLPVADVRTMAEVRRRFLGRYEVWGRFWLAFAVAALALAALGVYGVFSFAVAQRTSEIGVRRALGASATSVQSDVLRRALLRVGAGTALGLWLGSVLSRGLGQVLYGVETTDPGVYVGVVVVMALVGLGASWWPARRAARVDPGTARRVP